MNIVVFSSISLAGKGGLEKVVKNLCESLRERGHRVNLIDGAGTEQEAGEFRSIRLDLPRLNSVGLPRVETVFKSLVSLLRIVRALLRLQPDVVNCHYPLINGLYFLLLKPFFRYRLVVSVHGSDLRRATSLRCRALRWLFWGADVVTAVSKSLASDVLDLYPHAPIRVVYNGIDVAYWMRAKDQKTKRNKQVITVVGALRYAKGQDVLIRALPQINQKFPRARLLLIGEGKKREEYMRLVQDLGVAERVLFAGELDREGVRDRLGETDVFVLPSRHEGFGIALVEAMAVGIPVVGTRVGGIPEVIGEKAGYLVPPDDEETLANTLISILSFSPEKLDRLGQAAQQRARRFEWDQTVNAYERLLRGED